MRLEPFGLAGGDVHSPISPRALGIFVAVNLTEARRLVFIGVPG